MKTCSNPKCNMTSIPDDAMFCPKCGRPISKVSETWTQKHKELQDEHAELLRQRSNLCEFEKERQKLLKTLEQDPNFEPAKRENITIIRYNRFSMPRKKRWFYIMGCILILIPLFDFVFDLSSDEWFYYFPIWFHLLSAFVCVFIFLPGGIILIGYGGELQKSLLADQYITNFYIPFIDQHQWEYRYVDDSYCVYNPDHPVYDNILEVEIFEPETISHKITDKIEELDDEIKDIEKQMRLMIELNTK